MVRSLRNVSNDGIELNDTEVEEAFNDLADIMDTMMTNNCGFDKAVKLERKADEGFGEWLEAALLAIGYR
ncbi:hypothetical protein [Lacrimispora xylanolytica]